MVFMTQRFGGWRTHWFEAAVGVHQSGLGAKIESNCPLQYFHRRWPDHYIDASTSAETEAMLPRAQGPRGRRPFNIAISTTVHRNMSCNTLPTVDDAAYCFWVGG